MFRVQKINGHKDEQCSQTDNVSNFCVKIVLSYYWQYSLFLDP